MKIRVFVIVIVIFLLTGVSLFWLKEATLPVDPASNESKIFVIKKGESIREIANNLKKSGLVRDQIAFFVLVKKMDVEKKIQAGDFRLKASLTTQDVIKELQHGTLDVWLTILEGWRMEEIALKLAQELAIPEQEFLKYAQEGYMFPDTYLLPKQASASAVVKIMKDNFGRKVNEVLRKEMESKGLALEEVIILASLVEKEAGFVEDKPKIASVFLNRLKIGMKLDVDATVQYALGYQSEEKTWWKKGLSKKDLEIDSPFNTYKNKRLPPMPIANPGLFSIKAVINPAQTDYFYYLSDKEGRIYYAKTLEEHNKNIRKYLNN